MINITLPDGSKRPFEQPVTVQEVAASIVGEILAIRRGFEGGFLSGSVRSLHRPEDRRLLASS